MSSVVEEDHGSSEFSGRYVNVSIILRSQLITMNSREYAYVLLAFKHV